MKTKLRYEIFSIFTIIITAISSVYFYFHFPDQVPMHWNFKGEIDSWSSKEFGAFFTPCLLILLYLMFLVLPKIDPKKERYEQFIKPYKILQNLVILFLAIMYYAVALYIFGYEINIGVIVPLFVGLLFVIIGNYMGKLKSNWFVGIRTPWTLSSEEVWNKTHRFGGKIFMLGGLLLGITAYIPAPINFYLFIINLIFIVFTPVVYSYIMLKKEKKNNNRNNSI